MNIQHAAIQILKDAGKPLHATEITKLIIDAGLWKSYPKFAKICKISRYYV